VLELMALYPQPVHTQQAGVEYLPVPRQKGTVTAAVVAALLSICRAVRRTFPDRAAMPLRDELEAARAQWRR